MNDAETCKVVHRAMLQTDVKDSSDTTTRRQHLSPRLKTMLRTLVRDGLHDAGLEETDYVFHDRGDGGRYDFGPHVEVLRVVKAITGPVSRRLFEHNETMSQALELRLRFAVHQGDVVSPAQNDESAGEAVHELVRILDSDRLRAELAQPGTGWVLALSDSVWRTIELSAGEIEPRHFEETEVIDSKGDRHHVRLTAGSAPDAPPWTNARVTDGHRTLADRIRSLTRHQPRTRAALLACIPLAFLLGWILTWYAVAEAPVTVSVDIETPGSADPEHGGGLSDCYPPDLPEACGWQDLVIHGDPPDRDVAEILPVLENVGVEGGACVRPAKIILAQVVDGQPTRSTQETFSGEPVDIPLRKTAGPITIRATIDNLDDDEPCKVTLTVPEATLHG